MKSTNQSVSTADTNSSTVLSVSPISKAELFRAVDAIGPPHRTPSAPNVLVPASPSGTQLTIAIIDLSASYIASPAATKLDIAMRRFNGMTLLEWCVRRLSESTMLDNTIVTGLPSYQPQVQATGLCAARWMPSLESDSISRISQIADRTNATWIAIVSPNCPFFDAALLDRLVASAWIRPEADYITYTSSKDRLVDWNRFGLSCEVIHKRMLTIAKENKLDIERGLSGTIKSYPNLFQSRFVPLPEQLDQDNLHFALETSQDWEQAYNFLEAAGDDNSWQRLIEIALMKG